MNAMKRREAGEAALAAALPAVERLKSAVAAETAAIAARGVVAYEDYSRRKSQGLLDLNRLAPALKRATADDALKAALAELNAALETNRRALRVQLEASIAVADLIARAIRDGQSDGTYTAQAWKRPPE